MDWPRLWTAQSVSDAGLLSGLSPNCADAVCTIAKRTAKENPDGVWKITDTIWVLPRIGVNSLWEFQPQEIS